MFSPPYSLLPSESLLADLLTPVFQLTVYPKQSRLFPSCFPKFLQPMPTTQFQSSFRIFSCYRNTPLLHTKICISQGSTRETEPAGDVYQEVYLEELACGTQRQVETHHPSGRVQGLDSGSAVTAVHTRQNAFLFQGHPALPKGWPAGHSGPP